ncbi:MAG TPA: trypsin-like serine protease [Acholeplasmataceae bacterium]|jgi:serine protease Do|nr:trypsin-like serine protease [Acholeplasmataceae bacterium]
MRRKLLIILLLFLVLSGCSSYQEFKISYDELTTLNLGDTYELPNEINGEEVEWETDSSILELNNNKVFAKAPGYANIYGFVNDDIAIKKSIVVESSNANIIIDGKINIYVGDETKLNATVNPLSIDQNVLWTSSDEDVAIIDQEGNVKALSEGITIITATSKLDENISSSKVLYVMSSKLSYEEIILEIIEEEKAATIDHILAPLIENASSYVIGVSNYLNSNTVVIGSGIIYKRHIVLKNGDIIENIDDISKINNIERFDYWVITNRHVIINNSRLAIYFQDDEIPAQLIEYDDKEDLAVLKFSSNLYFPVAKFSEEVSIGDFVIAIGHSHGYEYFSSATFGIVSHPERYLSTDTDNDGQNDWDAQYIQHDAPINEGNSGGPLINLKGEVIGINTIKKSDLFDTIDNIGFAISSSLALEIVELLEQGIRPQRAILGVTVLSVKDYMKNKNLYPDVKVPEWLDYGFYITEVRNGIAKLAGALPGDIIIKFNGKNVRYSHELRAEINKYPLGSNEIVEMVVIRNNEEVTLYVRY